MSTTDKYVTSATSVTGHVYNTVNTSPTKTSLSDHISRVTTKSSSRSPFVPTMAPVKEIVTTVTAPTTFSHHSTTSYTHFSRHPDTSSTLGVSPQGNSQSENIVYQDEFERTTALPSTENAIRTQSSQESLAALLRREGLFAMAKYLRQSGLDNVLNETGKLACHLTQFN